MICQSIKREQWIDKLKTSLLAVPYVHVVFTLPHQLNGLARNNQKTIYGLVLQAAWLTIKKIFDPLDCMPGMTCVLHTFGSDLKYHIHVHALVTFGGLSPHGLWVYPVLKNKIAKYRAICSVYKNIMIHHIEHLCKNHEIQYHEEHEKIIAEVKQVRWVVHSTRPAMDTQVIEKYLARYINRIAISNSRLCYIRQHKEVKILYNNYKQQLQGKPAPKIIKSMEPLVVMHQILQHVLPPRFPKSRSYGLHHASSKIKNCIPKSIRRHPLTVRTIMEILYHLCSTDPYACEKCSSKNYTISLLASDKEWKDKFLKHSIHRIRPSDRSPPLDSLSIPPVSPPVKTDSTRSHAYST